MNARWCTQIGILGVCSLLLQIRAIFNIVLLYPQKQFLAADKYWYSLSVLPELVVVRLLLPCLRLCPLLDSCLSAVIHSHNCTVEACKENLASRLQHFSASLPSCFSADVHLHHTHSVGAHCAAMAAPRLCGQGAGIGHGGKDSGGQ